MKTTLDLEDALFVAAKKRAVEQRRPLRALVEDGLRLVLARGARVSGQRRHRIKWVTSPGGLPQGLDLADRAAMSEWMRRASGQR